MGLEPLSKILVYVYRPAHEAVHVCTESPVMGHRLTGTWTGPHMVSRL